MKLRCLSSVVLVVVLFLAGNDNVKASQIDLDVTRQKIDDACSGPEDCKDIANGLCRDNKCSCIDGYFGVPKTPLCSSVDLGVSCALWNKNICEHIPNAWCDPMDHKCKCEKGYDATDKNKCTKASAKVQRMWTMWKLAIAILILACVWKWQGKQFIAFIKHGLSRTKFS